MSNQTPGAWADDDYCYLTTTGRVSGNAHTIEIWFVLHGATVYMLAGGGEKSDWVKNIQRNAAASVRLRDQTWQGIGRIVTAPEEDALARRLVVEKYQPRHNENLDHWGRTALPVAVDLQLGV